MTSPFALTVSCTKAPSPTSLSSVSGSLSLNSKPGKLNKIMVREREELYITVPSMFRCPISLDVMRSPVSLCTGVTYDRSSIQHWLESGHDTCPATMQILTTKEFIPNLTLHRLISTWSRPSSTVSGSDLRLLIDNLASHRESLDSLAKIAEFAGSCEDNRRFLARYAGFVETVAGVLRRDCVEIVVLESVIRVLDLILTENGVKEKLNSLILNSGTNSLSSIVKVIENGNTDLKIKSVKILDSISFDKESKRQLMETEGILSILFNHLKKAEDQNLDDAVLSILINLSATRSVKTELIRFGLVRVLSNTLWDPKSANANIEKAIKLLSMVVTCSEGRVAVREEARCAAGIVDRIMKVKNKTAREEGMVVLWSMCCLYKDRGVTEAVVKSNGVTKMLLVMQSENEGIVRGMCGDLIKVLGKNGNCGLGVYDSKTAHIMPY